MQNQVIALSIIVGVAIFLVILAIATLIYQSHIKNSLYYRSNPDDWFFYKFSTKIYEALFGITEPEDIALKLGIDVKEYYEDCIVVGVEPDIRGIIVDYIFGFLSMIVCFIFAFLFNIYFIMLGLIMMYFFMKNKRRKVKNEAELLRSQIQAEFPRFLGLLSTELEVGLPIEIAIDLLSRKYDSLLSKEFLNSFNTVKLGAYNWQGALNLISNKYQIDELSDFVLDVTTAFNKGTSISEAVARRTKEMKAERLYSVKEKAARTENLMLIPIALLQFLPMMAYILLPTLSSVSTL